MVAGPDKGKLDKLLKSQLNEGETVVAKYRQGFKKLQDRAFFRAPPPPHTFCPQIMSTGYQ